MHPLLTSLLFALAAAVAGDPVRSATVEGKGGHGVVVLRSDGGVTRRVAAKGDAMQAILSPDRRVVAVVRGAPVDGRWARTALELVTLRDGAVHTQRVEIDQPFIRDLAFLDDARLVVDAGGMHFAGTLLLVDARSGAVRERFSVVEGRGQPEWAAAFERLRSAPAR